MSGHNMAPVRRRDLVVLALGLALASWLLVRAYYGQVPPLHWWLGLPLGVLALVEAVLAWTTRTRLADVRAARAGQQPSRRGAPAPEQVRPVEPLAVARMAILAQASAYVGAVFAGLWGGVLAFTGPAVGRLQAAGGDTVGALVGVVCSLALVGAALWLESVCRVPPNPPGGAPGATGP